MVRQSRGLILDEDKHWSVVARPFDKFFNHGEQLAADIDWTTVTIHEKLDGSLIIMYYYDGKWQIATSGSPDAMGEVGSYGITFNELFWDVWNDKKYSVPSTLHVGMTFMFELTTPYNKIVVRHPGCNIRLIGVRNNLSGMELPIRNFASWELAREFPICGSFEALIKQFETMEPTAQEGYVVIDQRFHRVKVKHPGYVLLHHLKSSASPKNMLEVIRRGETTEVLANFPEWTDVIDKMQARYDALTMNLEQFWGSIKPKTTTLLAVASDKPSRKIFAGEASRCLIPGAMFSLLDERVKDAREYLKEMPIDSLAHLLKIEEIAEGLILV